MNMTTKRLIIRDFELNDLSFYIELESSFYTHQYETDQLPKHSVLQTQFNDILKSSQKTDRDKYSMITTKTDDQTPIGRIVIWQLDQDINEWEIGWFMLEAYTSKGYAKEAASAIISFAFETLKAHRIQALCHEKNVASERLMQHIGMKKEGLLRGIRKLNGRYANMLIYAILKEDFDDMQSLKTQKEPLMTRYANLDDIKQILRYDQHITRTMLENAINEQRVIVMCLHQEVIGVLRYGLFWDAIPMIHMISFDAINRGQGLGKKLHAFFEHEMKLIGYKMLMTTTQSDEFGQHFFRNIGYQDHGSFSFPNQADELILFKEIIST